MENSPKNDTTKDWIINNFSEIQYRNLGYYSVIQTELSNLFKSYIYDWIILEQNQEILKKELNKHMKIDIAEYKTKLFLQKEYYYLGIIDLFILNQYHNIPVMCYDKYDNIFLIIDKRIIFNQFITEKNASNKTMVEKKKYNKNKI